MTDQEKIVFLSGLVKQSKELLEQAVAFADQHSLTFMWDDEYGSRKQTYVGKGARVPSKYGGWTSSSDDC